MPVIQNQVSLAAGASTNNFLAGSAFEFARVPELISIGIAATLTGGFVGLTVGNDLVLEDTPPVVIVAATNGGFPIIPDQMLYNDVAQPGDRIVLRGRNPTGGAIVFSWIVQISPLK